MKTAIFFFTFCITISCLHAQKFVNRWQNVYGGNGADILSSVRLTKDKGFILSGYSSSNRSGNKKENANQNSNDYWIVKTNALGAIQWSKTIGGTGDEINTSLIQTKDGGYLVGGISVSNISVNKTKASRDSSYDFWVVKLDAAGNILWDNTFGGSYAETMQALGEADGYYIAAGSSYSNKGYEKKEDNLNNESWADYWIIKMTTSGSIVWAKTYAGNNQDLLSSLQVCKDGSYFMGGYSYSPRGGQKSTYANGNCDYYVVKIDPSGNTIWDESYGGKFSDYMTDVKETSDGGFILGGYSNSAPGDDKSAAFLGYTDYWVVKTNKAGVKKWDKSYGGSKGDYLTSIQQTADKGYLLGGYSNSNAGNSKSEASIGGYDYWIVKTDSAGNKIWDKTIGGSKDDKLASVLEIAPGEYLAAGTSSSPKSGYKSTGTIGNTGKSDYWLVRFGITGTGLTKETDNQIVSSGIQITNKNSVYTRLHVTLSPNPATNNLMVNYTNAEEKNNELTVLSADGKVIHRTVLRGTANTLSVDVSNYKAGIYYVSLLAGNKTVVQKFIKE